MKIREEISKYIPYNEQEEKDKKQMLKFMDSFEDVLTRDNTFGHFTASVWIVNEARDKVLMAYHNIYESWAWLGGHADGQEDLLRVALKETKEESGLNKVKLLSKDIFSIETVTVDGHVKKEKYVSSHLHFNVTYLLEADEQLALTIKPDENSGLKWIPIDEVQNHSTEKWMVERVYPKLIDKMKLASR